jgi:hypothetical protein
MERSYGGSLDAEKLKAAFFKLSIALVSNRRSQHIFALAEHISH